MIQLCGACFGLLLFSAMILCGMLAGNPVMEIVKRALLGLLGGFFLGSVSGWIGLFVVRDNVTVSESVTPVAQEEAVEDDSARAASA